MALALGARARDARCRGTCGAAVLQQEPVHRSLFVHAADARCRTNLVDAEFGVTKFVDLARDGQIWCQSGCPPPLSQLRLRCTGSLLHGTHAVLFSVTGTTPPLAPNNHVSRANIDYKLQWACS